MHLPLPNLAGYPSLFIVGNFREQQPRIEIDPYKPVMVDISQLAIIIEYERQIRSSQVIKGGCSKPDTSPTFVCINKRTANEQVLP